MKEGASSSNDPQLTKLQIKASKYILIDDILYKKSFTIPYLKCLGENKVDYTLKEIQEVICGQHLRERALAHKALRQGFYWLTMKKK